MKNQLVLLSQETTRAETPRAKTTRAERTHRRADLAREALREASQRVTEREAARRRAREQALLAAASQPRLLSPDSPAVPPTTHRSRRPAA